MVRILLALPFITVNWFLLLRHRPHLLTLAISDSHILDSDNGATLTVARGVTGGSVVITHFKPLLYLPRGMVPFVMACGCS